MVVYPQFFTVNNTLNKYDTTKTTVAWRLFKRNLITLFHCYHSKQERSLNYRLFQSRSCFADITRNNDLVGEGHSVRISEPDDELNILDDFSGGIEDIPCDETGKIGLRLE